MIDCEIGDEIKREGFQQVSLRRIPGDSDLTRGTAKESSVKTRKSTYLINDDMGGSGNRERDSPRSMTNKQRPWGFLRERLFRELEQLDTHPVESGC